MVRKIGNVGWPSRAPVYDERYDGPTVGVPVFQVMRTYLEEPN